MSQVTFSVCTRTSTGSSVLDISHHHRQVHVAVDDVFVSDRAKASVDGRQIGFHDAPHERLFADAIPNQIGNRDHLQIDEARQTPRSSGSRAIVPSSFMISQMTPAG